MCYRNCGNTSLKKRDPTLKIHGFSTAITHEYASKCTKIFFLRRKHNDDFASCLQIRLTPCNFWLFPIINRELWGRQFSSGEKVTNAVPVFLRGLSADEFEKIIIKKWEKQMWKCVAHHGQQPDDGDKWIKLSTFCT